MPSFVSRFEPSQTIGFGDKRSEFNSANSTLHDRVKGARSVCTSEDLAGIQGLLAHVDPCFRSSPPAQVRGIRWCPNPSAQRVAATSGPIVKCEMTSSLGANATVT